MIDSAREVQARHEGSLAAGITSWFRGEDGPDAVAASRLLAETVLMYRAAWEAKHRRE